MKTSLLTVLAASSLAALTPLIAAETPRPQPLAAADRASLNKIIAAWPERPRLGAQQMIAKYGVPQEMTAAQLIWHNQGKFKRITVTKEEHHHDFPLPHTDYIEHTIDYRVPAEKAAELTKYDGSCTFDKTRGELSARCDLEGHNILTLNIAHDLLTGKVDAAEARKLFGKNVEDDMAGKYPPYTVALQFEPMKTPADADKPSIAGAPKRANPEPDGEVKGATALEPIAAGPSTKVKASKPAGPDAEILGVLMAVNTNEVVAAMEAAKKKLSEPIAEYAKMLHVEHGKNAADTMKVGQKIEMAPLETEKTNALRVKAAGELAALVPLDDDAFGKAYLAAMVKGHTEVLATIDNDLLKNADSEAVKKHLAATREHVAMHLAHAKKLQGEGAQPK